MSNHIRITLFIWNIFLIRSSFCALAALSIDLGHQNIIIALVKPGVPMEIVLNRESHRRTDAHVSIRGKERSFGETAFNMRMRFPEQSYGFLVDLLGKKFDHPIVHLYRHRFPYYTLVPDQNRGTVSFQNEDAIYSVEELLGMIIADSRKMASIHAEQDVRDAVITVPAYFNQAERRAMVEAAEIGGVNLIQLMNDNTAAGLNYGMFRRKQFNETSSRIIIYDMGAVSTIATVFEYVLGQDKTTREKNPQMTVLGVGFDRTLGGLEITLRLRDYLAEQFEKQHPKLKLDIKKDQKLMNKLLKEAERVKKVLSANVEHLAQIESFVDNYDLKILVTRAQVEDMVTDLANRISGPVTKALEMAEISMDDIDYVILMGGGTRFPKFQEALSEAVKGRELSKFINTDEAMAMGAVYQAAHRSKGFKVKKFMIKELNLYPIVVDFAKEQTESEGDDATLAAGEMEKSEPYEETASREPQLVRLTLFKSKSQYPQKRKMTFSKHTHDFEFHVNYGDLSFLPAGHSEYFGELNVSRVFLNGVSENVQKNLGIEGSVYKGAKAHFRMDESGILQLESADISFEKTGAAAEAETASTLQKLGKKISSFFSASEGKDAPKIDEKNEETKLASEETPNAEQVEKFDAQKTETTKNETVDSKNTSNETVIENQKPKIINKDLPLVIEKSFMDINPIPSEQLKQSFDRIKEFETIENELLDLAQARNDLEAYVIDMKYKIEDDALYRKVSKEPERVAITSKCVEIIEWLDEQGPDTSKKEYVKRHDEIRALTKDLLYKVKEYEGREKGIEAMVHVFNYSSSLLVTMKNFTGPEDGIFTTVELNTLEKLINETQIWYDAKRAEQAKLDDSDSPVLTVQSLAEKWSALDREVKYLLNKAKFAKPKPKPSNETKDNATDTEKTKPGKTDKETGNTNRDDQSAQKDVEAEIPELDDASKSDSPAKEDEEDDVKHVEL